MTRKGNPQPTTNADVDHFAEEAERGYDVDHTSVSDIIRRAIDEYLHSS
jgi:hypothetical protein